MTNESDVLHWLLPILGGIAVILIGTLALSRDLAGVIARRYLTHFKLTIVSTITIFAVMGTTLAVAALTTVTGISTGFQAEFQRKVLGVNAHVLILKYLDFTEYRQVMEQVRQIPGVLGVNPFVINEMMVVNGSRIAGVLLKGVDPELMPTVLDLPEHLIEGSLEGLRLPGRTPPTARTPSWRRTWDRPAPGDQPLDGASDGRTPRAAAPDAGPPETSEDERPPEIGIPGVVPSERRREAEERELDEAVADALDIALDPAPEPEVVEELPGIVLGRTLAQELDAQVGDTVRIVTPLNGLDVSLWAPEAQVPRSREFRVIGLFYSGFDEYDTRLVYVDLFEAQAFYDHGDVVTGVELRLEDPNMAPTVASEIEAELGGTPYRILDWENLNHNLFTALRIQKMVLSLVVSLLVLVSGLLIISTLVLMIFEKKREIAILKAMGATNGVILRLFILVGSTIGAVGTFLGIALGYSASKFLIAYGWPLDPGVYLIDHLPVEIDPVDYIVVSCVAMGTAIISTIFPAWFTAATMKPVDGLRYE